MKLKPRLGLMVVGAMLCVLAFAIWPRRMEQIRTLSDGSELTLRLVTYDRRHREVLGDRWLDRVARWLPEGVAKHLNTQFVTGGDTNELRFWLVRSGALTGSGPQFWATTGDGHGCELGLTTVSEFPISRQQSLWTVGFPIFPRREREVMLRILELSTNGTWSEMAQFVVPNPDRREYPKWPVPSLPQTNRVGEIDLVLHEALGGVLANRAPVTAWVSGERPGIYLRFGSYRGGQRASDWGIVGLEGLSDATGHFKRGGGYVSGTTKAGDFYVITEGGLCLHESSWNLAIAVARQEQFPPEDRWEISAVPVPAMAATNSVVNVATNLHGIACRFHGVIGPKSTEPKARRMLSDEYLLHFSCPGAPEDVRLELANVTDSSGTKLRTGGRAHQGLDYFFAVQVPPGTKNLNIVFVATRTVRMNFRFQPKVADADTLRRLAQ